MLMGVDSPHPTMNQHDYIVVYGPAAKLTPSCPNELCSRTSAKTLVKFMTWSQFMFALSSLQSQSSLLLFLNYGSKAHKED